MTEAELKAQVLALAKDKGWLVYHVGNRLGQQHAMNGNGFPDLVLARRGQVRFIELKAEKANLEDAQWKWYRELGPLCTVVRPGDLADGRVEVLLA